MTEDDSHKVIWTPGMTLHEAKWKVIKAAIDYYGTKKIAAEKLKIGRASLYWRSKKARPE